MRRSRTRWIALLCGASALLSCATALAEPDAVTRRAARLLGEEALALYDRGDHAAALEKLNQADALVSAPTLDLYAARCLANLGRLVEAARRYEKATGATLEPDAPASHKDAQADATKELEALAAKIPSLEIAVQDTAGAPVTSGVAVSVDGVDVPADRLSDKQPTDPGEHKVEARRGDDHVLEQVTLREGDRARVVLKLPVLEPPPAPAPKPVPAPASGSLQRTIGWIALGVGAVGTAAWGVTGALALAEDGDLADMGCREGRCPGAVDLGSYGALRTVSTVAFWSGLAGLGVGGVLLLTAPSASPPAASARVTPWIGPASAGLRGAF